MSRNVVIPLHSAHREMLLKLLNIYSGMTESRMWNQYTLSTQTQMPPFLLPPSLLALDELMRLLLMLLLLLYRFVCCCCCLCMPLSNDTHATPAISGGLGSVGVGQRLVTHLHVVGVVHNALYHVLEHCVSWKYRIHLWAAVLFLFFR